MVNPAETALPPFATHEVFNQPPALQNYNLYRSDKALQEAVDREGGSFANATLSDLGAELGRSETIEWGFQANQNPPKLHTFDRFGRRRDEVEFHPAYHHMMELSFRHGLHASPWAEPRAGAHVARAAGVIMMVQIEAGVQCPTTMTYGVVPALRRQPDLAAAIEPKLFSRRYDSRFRPIAEKTGMAMGMGMTEKQGGSDLRTNTTQAEPIGNGEYRITGHKWFFSAPMCDAFLVLAYAPGGLSCFYMPRFTPDGELNAIRIQRLKSKLGNWSNASSEVEFHRAYARIIGEEGRGVPNIIEMATYTRLDCALGTTGLMRQAVAQALHHAAHRSAFQRRLIDQPLMSNVLADLVIEQEAATALVMRLARAFDRQDSAKETSFRRLLTPAIKYWICKRGPILGVEALEVLGGAGYVEESMMPRLHRELPLNSIWEGSGNVMCLDVLRAMQREPNAIDIFLTELKETGGGDRRLDRAIAALQSDLSNPGEFEARGRQIVARMAVSLQAALLLKHAPNAIAEAFIASRLEGGWSGAFGTLPAGTDFHAITARALPQAS